MTIKTRLKYLALGLIGSVAVCGGAYAATQSVTANMSFDSVLTLNKTQDINFGVVAALTGGTYVISTAGAVTPSNGGVVVGGTPAAASITVTGSATQTVAINTQSYSANNGVTPSAATCNYGGTAIANCDAGDTGLAAPGAGGRTLTVGVTATVDGTQAAGSTAAPTFDVVVIYG